MFNRLKKQKEQLKNDIKWLENDVEHLKQVKRILSKTTKCDFCILEHSKRERDFNNIQDSDYSISFLAKELNICKEHMKEFKDNIEQVLNYDQE